MRTKETNGVVYTPAPQTDGGEGLHHLAYDKTSRTCFEKCALSLCGLGLAVLLGSLVSGFLLKPYVNSRIVEAMALVEGEPVYMGWKDPPVSPVMKVTFS